MAPAKLANHIAKWLTARRLQQELTREQLAELSGVNVHTLKHFERSGQISFERLIAICNALGLEEEIRRLERLLKPRHRVNINSWQSSSVQPLRKRGRRKVEPPTSESNSEVDNCLNPT